MRHRIALVGVLCGVLGAQPARADSGATPAWYQEIRDIAEALIKRELGTNAAAQIAERSPALCFYLRETLSRVQTGYWANVPGELRGDLRDALADVVFSVASAESTASSLGEALRSFWTVATARYKKAVELRAGSPHPVCSTEWWGAETSPPLPVEKFVDSQCHDPQTLKEQFACTLARTVSPFMRDERSSAKRNVLDLAGALVVKAHDLGLASSLSPGAQYVARRLLKDWTADVESARTALRTVDSRIGNRLARALDETGDCEELPAVLSNLVSGEVTSIQQVGCLLGHEAKLGSSARLVIGTRVVPITSLPTQLQITEAFAAALETNQVAKSTDPAICAGAEHVKGVLEIAGTSREIHSLADGSGFCKAVIEDLKMIEVVFAARAEVAGARLRLKNASEVFGDDIAIEDVWELRQVLSKVIESLRHVAIRSETADWTLPLTLKFLRELVTTLPPSEQVNEIKAVLGRRDLDRLIEIADRKSYRTSVTSLLHSVDTKSMELRVFRDLLLYTADVTGDGSLAARDAFRAAALGYLGKSSDGLPVARDGNWSWGTSWSQVFLPALSLRINPNSEYDDWRRASVALTWPRAAVSFNPYLGIQVTALDVLGPPTELAYRDKRDHDNQRLLLLDFVRPRVELYAFFPPLTNRVAVTAGFGLRFLETKRAMDLPARYELGTSLQFELGVMFAW